MITNKTVLVVEDEADLAEVVRYNLEREGYRCRCVVDGTSALAEVRRERPDLLILDRMLPGMSGDEVISKLRREPTTAGIPVLMLTAKAEESDELIGFALGADDYVTKPFSMKRLLARVDALLRRAGTPAADSDVLTVGPLGLDRSRRELDVDGEPVTLTSTEFGILWELMAARGRVLSREQLIDRVLGAGAVVTDRTIDVHVAALRRKLGKASGLVQTVRGVGYTLRPSPRVDQ
jgi:two-component system phosphate regulon response regulator PhoB